MAEHLLAGGEITDDFAERVSARHRRTNRWRDPGGQWQLPWPRALGTQPWALARELSRPGIRYRVRFDDPSARTRDLDEIVAAVRRGRPVVLYIGNALAPRHVVLVFAVTPRAAALRVYDPATGGEVQVARRPYQAGKLRVAGWNEPWLAVLPY